MSRQILTFVFLCIFYPGLSQYVDSGQDPASINWKQIKSENFQVVFPETFTEQANKLANALEVAYDNVSKTLKHRPAKITVILHNFNTEANAMVLWAPKRMNFNTIPPQDIYPQPWLDQLALHEFRHVVQVDKMKQGFSKILFYLFGEQGTAGVFGAYIPFWLVEGDAVAIETGASHSGRGRLPSFTMPLRAQLLQKGMYAYEKAYLGSYKDFVPDYYTLGYLLVGMGRKEYGAELWEEIMREVARKPFIPNIFSHALKKRTGKNKYRYYRATLSQLDSIWKRQDTLTTLSPFSIKNAHRKGSYTSYLFPQYLKNGNIAAIKTSLDQIDEIVVLDSLGSEKHLFFPGLIQHTAFSGRGGKLTWAEFNYDVRWSNRIFSDIVTYDLESGKRKMITHRKYLFAPNLSSDGKKIIVAEATPDSKFALVVLDAGTGKELKRFPSPANSFLLTPVWASDNKTVAVIMLRKTGKSLQLLDTESGDFKEVIADTYQDITTPVFYKQYILFHSTWSGIDNIYAVDTTSKAIFQVTSSRFGAFNPAVNEERALLSYQDYTYVGYNIAETALVPEHWTRINPMKNKHFNLAEAISKEEKMVTFDTSAYLEYPIKPYHKGTHLFNLHSWSPVSLSFSKFKLRPSITLLSQNKLSTAFANLKYVYDYNEKEGNTSLSFTYKGLFPVLSLTASNGNRKKVLASGEKLIWNEKAISFSAYVPFNFTHKKYSQSFIPSISYSYVGLTPVSKGDEQVEGTFHAVSYAASWQNRRKKSIKDIRSRWGQTLSVGFKQTPAGNLKYSPQAYMNASIYLPGFLKHHSLLVSLDYQKNYLRDKNFFISSISYPRGYNFIQDEKNTIISVNYALPLAYPDLALRVVYIKRIYMNLFYDFGSGFNEGAYRQYQSIGTEIFTDVHFLSHILPFSLGMRFSYLPDVQIIKPQLLFNTSF